MSADTNRAMDEWTPHRQLSLSQARARTQAVRYMRFALVAAAIITLGIFLGFIARNAYDRSRGSNSLTSEETVAMLSPRFTGRDDNGDLYIITAERAERRRSNEDLVDLVNARLVDAFGSEVTAPRGRFNQETEVLDLFEDVLLVDTEGYVFNSTHAQVLTRTGLVIGVEPLDGTGPLGDVRADSYQFDNSTGNVTFTGRVETILFTEDDVEAVSDARREITE